MKPFLLLTLTAFFLIACTPMPAAPESHLPVSTATLLVEPTPTRMPVPTATPITCNPLVAQFCILEGNFIFQRPIHPPDNNAVAAMYRFGSTANGTREPHHGVEFVNALGTPVYAAAQGEVIFAGPDTEAVYSPWSGFYGNFIVIRHMDDLFTLYAHLVTLEVSEGQKVKAGQRIGEVGRSGAAIGSHLHFEVRQGREGRDYFSAQNPELWLLPREGRGVLEISILNEEGRFQPAELTLQYYPGNSSAPEKIYFIDTYAEEMTPVGENALMGELLAGRYRIAFTIAGRLYERWVEVESGKLTQVVIVVK